MPQKKHQSGEMVAKLRHVDVYDGEPTYEAVTKHSAHATAVIRCTGTAADHPPSQ